MHIKPAQIRAYRLRAHHLDKKIPMTGLLAAAGACGVQNSPPGAWETALFNRLKGCTLQGLHDALYKEKSLLQAWSYRGAPVVFPTAQSDVFLTALLAQAGEQPWIYTLGVSGALDFLQMPFDDLLARTKEAAKYLDTHIAQSKELLDRALAEIVCRDLPEEKRALWRAPSMYGHPDRQTVGEAAVSFLLRPCSFSSLVVFGERRGAKATFTSYQNWIGHAPLPTPDAQRALARKFFHCYGPANLEALVGWLGCSRRQGRRLFDAVAEELEPVQVEEKPCYMLREDLRDLTAFDTCEERLILLGAHDPYLDIKDRYVILEDKTLQKAVWKTVGNPGVIVKGGRAVGIWRQKTLKHRLEISMGLFEALDAAEQRALDVLAEEYAAFRGLSLDKLEKKIFVSTLTD